MEVLFQEIYLVALADVLFRRFLLLFSIFPYLFSSFSIYLALLFLKLIESYFYIY